MRYDEIVTESYDPRARYRFDPPELTDLFWRWFGMSKVVGHDGKPLVMWHGAKDPKLLITNKRAIFATAFDVFDTSKRIEPGAWFSADPGIAAHYGTPVPFYLKVEHPCREEDPITAVPAGCDGIYRTRSGRSSISDAWEIAVFQPNQIKAVFNAGTFALDDPRHGH